MKIKVKVLVSSSGRASQWTAAVKIYSWAGSSSSREQSSGSRLVSPTIGDCSTCFVALDLLQPLLPCLLCQWRHPLPADSGISLTSTIDDCSNCLALLFLAYATKGVIISPDESDSELCTSDISLQSISLQVLLPVLSCQVKYQEDARGATSLQASKLR